MVFTNFSKTVLKNTFQKQEPQEALPFQRRLMMEHGSLAFFFLFYSRLCKKDHNSAVLSISRRLKTHTQGKGKKSLNSRRESY